MARLAGFEPATLGLEGRCSIRMSYKRPLTKYGRGRGIRTPDILLPKQARYQTALYPERKALYQKNALLPTPLFGRHDTYSSLCRQTDPKKWYLVYHHARILGSKLIS